MNKILTIITCLALVACSGEQKKAISMNDYEKVNIDDVRESASKMINDDWMLITAGTVDNFNTMTASWGMLGHVWGKDATIVFIRPQRYTYQFMESGDRYTLSFYDKSYRDALNVLGTKSGRDGDKVKEVGFSPIETPSGAMAFGEARLIIECKKLYGSFLNEDAFADTTISTKIYPTKDFHKMYVGEIVNVWKRK